MKQHKFFNNKTILITGGTGSLGVELTKYLLKNFNIKKLILFSRDEQKHFRLEKEFSDERIRFLIGDIRDFRRITMALKEVDYVIHAAAQKHVHLSEYNPQECVNTNIFGTQNVIEACIKENVKKCILISTDKSVNPINLYGATKLVAEKIILSGNHLSGKNGTIFSVVRYGNVLGSNGSILPFFSNLNKEKKKIPITHHDMTRFWISYEEAIELVISCLIDSRRGDIFVPILNSIKITDFVKIINPKAKIYITGIKKGEKIHEELITLSESEYAKKVKNFYIVNYDLNKKNNYKFDYTSKNNLFNSEKSIKSSYINIIKNFL
jgi:UDP-N-acetylglucosamine 4,6-dehydratase